MKRARKSAWGILYKAHRYIGLVIAIVVIMLAVTGILINHTDELQLAKRFIGSDWILDWYGVNDPPELVSFQTNRHRITQVEDQIYFDSDLLTRSPQKLRGAVENDQFLVIAFPYLLILLTPEGEIVEQIKMKESLRGNLGEFGMHYRDIRAIGTDRQGNVYLDTEDLLYFSDDGLLSWKQPKSPSIQWAKPAVLSSRAKTRLSLSYRSRIFNLERILLDLHSGRFFGEFGVYFIDLTSLLFTFLAMSGCLIWIQHKLRRIVRKYRGKKATHRQI